MKINEENFIRELKNKNPKALDYLVANYSNLIFKVVISVLGSDNREVAKECLNDVLLKTWEKINYHDESKSKFTSWLIAVSKYNAIDYKRKLNKTENECNIDELVLADEITVEEQIVHSENKEEIFNVIKALGSPDKDIFIRKYFLGETQDEIGEALKLSRSAVNSRLFRGRKLLKEKLVLVKEEVI